MLTHGDYVEYCLDSGPNSGQYRPALVVRVWTDSCAQLQVFTDRLNDGPDPLGQDWFRSSVCSAASVGDGPGRWRPLPSRFVFNTTAAPMIMPNYIERAVPHHQPFVPMQPTITPFTPMGSAATATG